uniref:Putative calcium-binding protein C800.10c n=1 Tax=Anthurium amnicola TaxID=1678845 RepID=A0A1D1XL63_9ARAE
MAARPGQAPNMEAFDAYFRRADLDMDGRISGAEAVAFFQGSNLPKQILAQIWMYSDSKKIGFLNRPEFYNALKLVTVAQSGRELTPEIVKAALEGPAAAKIPAPQINPVATPALGNQITMQRPPIHSMMAPQIGTMTSASSQTPGFRGPQTLSSANLNQQFFSSTDGQHLRPNQAGPNISSHSLVGQGIPTGGMGAAPRLPNTNIPNLSTDWLSGRMGGASQVPRFSTPSATQGGFGPTQSSSTALVSQRAHPSSADDPSLPPKPVDPLSSVQPSMKDSKASVVSANGFLSDLGFGGDMFSAAPQPKQGASTAAFAASGVPNSSGITSTSPGLQPSVSQVQSDPLQSSSTMTFGDSQLQRAQSFGKPIQSETVQGTSASTPSVVSVGSAGPASSSPERPWPKFSRSDIMKYSKVFVEVDKDRDGKITGEQARELFLSWKLPREILKQVWDLSDQDNDSMLSHREFVTALYLMERYREGYTLPTVLPNNVKFDETLLQTTGQPSVPYGGTAWQPSPGFPQQRMPGSRPIIPVAGSKLQAQAREPRHIDGQMQPVHQKPTVPVLEKHLVYQLTKEEQDALNSKFQEATDADKKVQELEKEILDSKEKIEFYRTKMQELVLYKSRCDNRLNEITEKASADKREVELLAKKYEEKYKQVGDVASKLTVEEATFRDVQERKLELYNAIVKMEQGGSADGLLQVRADRIQSDLEELVKALNGRCKKYGLRVKPTTLIELPFGWQPGIQEGAADWDEDWDKFEDEGFAVVKELTVDVNNIIAPPMTKPSPVGSDKASKDELSSPGSSPKDNKKPSSVGERITGGETVYAQSEDDSVRSPPGSPPGRSSLESPSQDFHPAQFGPDGTSPRIKESQSDHGGAESTISGEKFVDETSWGATFDTNDDADSIWDFNTKESDHERNKQSSFFDSGDFGLNPIRTDSLSATSLFGTRIDSPSAASIFGTRTDSPSAASVFGKKEKSPFFADSVPGTPLFNSGFSPRYEGSDDHSFDSFSRFDSFSMHDSGLFPQRENLTRFDSIRSTSDQSRMFTFDDPDPFGSSGPFKTSESNAPSRGSDKWSAF